MTPTHTMRYEFRLSNMYQYGEEYNPNLYITQWLGLG